MPAAQLFTGAVKPAYGCPALKRLVKRFRTAARRPQAVMISGVRRAAPPVAVRGRLAAQ